MLFSEIYGSYFNVVAKIIEESLNNTLSDKRLYEIVNEKGFAESVMNIPNSLKSGEWGIMTSDLKTPIKNKPEMPLTTLQKRWLKALINDPRIKLFDISASDLDDIEPLYTNDMFEYFDKYSDGDDFENPDYIKNFRTIISAIKSKNKLVVRFISRHGKGCAVCVIPHRLEYSQKDDKFRLISVDSRNTYIINLSRITSCSIAGKYNANEDREEQRNIKTLVLNLTDDRMALERFMHHFSYLKKQTEQLSTKEYRITIEYDIEDETEILIRILSFGPLIRVVSPKSFIEKLKSRINKQISCELF